MYIRNTRIHEVMDNVTTRELTNPLDLYFALTYLCACRITPLLILSFRSQRFRETPLESRDLDRIRSGRMAVVSISMPSRLHGPVNEGGIRVFRWKQSHLSSISGKVSSRAVCKLGSVEGPSSSSG